MSIKLKLGLVDKFIEPLIILDLAYRLGLHAYTRVFLLMCDSKLPLVSGEHSLATIISCFGNLVITLLDPLNKFHLREG